MKTSTKLLFGVFFLLLLSTWFPQLFGKIRWNMNTGKTGDFISAFWLNSNSSVKLMGQMPQHIKYIKFLKGDANDDKVTIIASDSIKISNHYPNKLRLSLSQDTLFVKMLPYDRTESYINHDSYLWIRPDVQLLFEDCNATVHLGKTDDRTMYATQKPILLRQNSHVQFFATKDSTKMHPHLNLDMQASGHSFAILYDFVIHQFNATLDNSQISYGQVQIDQINVKSKGRSLLSDIRKKTTKSIIGDTNITHLD